AQAVQDRGVQVMHVNRILGDVVREIVGRSVSHAAADAATGEPDREAARMMVSAVVVGRQLALAVNRAPELAAPNDERVVQQAALFQITNQRGGWLIGVFALATDRLRQTEMLIP